MKRILIAEGDAAARKMLARVLESCGYIAIQASGHSEAVLKLRTTQPALVIVDLESPDEQGWKPFDNIRALDALTPLIAITSWPQQHPHAIQRGIDALLEKPLDLATLLQTIQDLTEEPDPNPLPGAKQVTSKRVRQRPIRDDIRV